AAPDRWRSPRGREIAADTLVRDGRMTASASLPDSAIGETTPGAPSRPDASPRRTATAPGPSPPATPAAGCRSTARRRRSDMFRRSFRIAGNDFRDEDRGVRAIPKEMPVPLEDFLFDRR